MKRPLRDLMLCRSCQATWSREVGDEDLCQCPNCFWDGQHEWIEVFEDCRKPPRSRWELEDDLAGSSVGQQARARIAELTDQPAIEDDRPWSDYFTRRALYGEEE